MSKLDNIWIKSMEWCDKYWGCHQMPERSFFLGGYQLPVCARCTGILLGNIFALFTFWLIPFYWWYILLLLPMAIDGFTQLANWRTSNNLLRLFTGMLSGYSIILIVANIIKSFIIALK